MNVVTPNNSAILRKDLFDYSGFNCQQRDAGLTRNYCLFVDRLIK